jgi:hypothetical protein
VGLCSGQLHRSRSDQIHSIGPPPAQQWGPDADPNKTACSLTLPNKPTTGFPPKESLSVCRAGRPSPLHGILLLVLFHRSRRRVRARYIFGRKRIPRPSTANAVEPQAAPLHRRGGQRHRGRALCFPQPHAPIHTGSNPPLANFLSPENPDVGASDYFARFP